MRKGREFAELEVPWLPVQGTDRQLSPVKRHFDVLLGKMLQPEKRSPEDVEVPYLKAQHIQWDKVVTQDLPTMWATPEEVRSLRVRKGDLLVCEGGEVGRATIVTDDLPEDCIIQNALHLVRPKKSGDVRFLRYVLRHATSQEWLDVLCNRATIAHFTVEKFSEMCVRFPPLSEQRAIAAYLDRETAKIDELISEKERLIELLAEKRRALITHAVTRGLDPDVSRRDSGVEWLGEIPEHWYTARLKTVCESLQTGPFGSQLHAEDYVEGGKPVVNPAHLANGKIIPDKRISVDQETAERLVIHELEDGDVVFARRGEIGRCGLVTQREAGWLCGTGSLRARPDKSRLFSKYLVLIMTNTLAGTWLSLMSVGTTMDNLNTEIVGALTIPLPSLEEQFAIVAFIESETAQIETLYAAVERTIKLLRERRAALISAAVTGQIRMG